jgi:Ca2+-binding EF-hand superfamily protein
MMKSLLRGAAAAAILAGGAALASTVQAPTSSANPTSAPPRHMRHMKAETRADMNSHVSGMFSRLDSNHDGFITQAEIESRQAERAQRMQERAQHFDPTKIFDRMDLNHDGKITQDEAQAARSQHSQAKNGKPAEAHAAGFHGLFARADTDKDGVITRAEFDTMAAGLKARMQQAGMTHGMQGRLFEMADTNKDGKVSLAEMQALAQSHFDQMDLNHDGTITPDERQQARQLFKAKHHAG